MSRKLRLRHRKSAGFHARTLKRRKEHAKQVRGYLKQKSSFLVAAISLVAFIGGNMVGQHGWYAFWKAALGQGDDSLITYTGTVTPLALVPDYERWGSYGGTEEEHTFRQVPSDALVPMPAYESAKEQRRYEEAPAGDVYSIGYLGSYETGAEGEGSHVGVDIRVPEGTPVRSIANGIVDRVANDAGGFGKLIVVRHPHMPDPNQPSKETVLYSSYAHLSEQYVREGEVVQKGQEIGLSGQSGFATGPHLHFQIDRDTAPWHPYWPFTTSELRDAGLTTVQAINAAFHREQGEQYTVNPILYAQRNFASPTIKDGDGKLMVKKESKARPSTAETLTALRTTRRQARLVRLGKAVEAVAVQTPAVTQVTTVATVSESLPPAVAPVIVPPALPEVKTVDIQHDQRIEGRAWENVRITLRDAAGNVASEKYFKQKLYMRTAYGEAEFDPPVLTAANFQNGSATVRMLPRGQRTVVILVEPFSVLSAPMEHVRR